MGTREKEESCYFGHPRRACAEGKKVEGSNSPAAIPEFGEGASSAAKTKGTLPSEQRTEEPTIMPKVPTVKVVEMKVGKAEKPKLKK